MSQTDSGLEPRNRRLARAGAAHLAARLLGVLVLLAAPAAAQADGVHLRGPASVRDTTVNAFGFPARVLDARQRRAFAVGNAFFKDNWVTAPASAAGRDGLGPLFNARSCSTCHLRDGRGRPPREGEREPTGLLLRLGVPADGPDLPHPVYGGQLQDHAVGGLAPEGRLEITHRVLRGRFPDGVPWELLEPRYSISSPAYGELRGVSTGPRVAPQLIGLGLLEAVPAADVIARADPDDADGDGISGRAHLVASRRSGERALGRFGWKATKPTVEEQCAAAFVNDIGITSPLQREESLGPRQAIEFTSGGSPEMDDHKLGRVAYCLTLAVPERRDAEATRGGERLFERIGCAACHVATRPTGGIAVVEAYTNRDFHPYTDLLLHDMGPALADGKHDGESTPAEWRTPPLWGIGLFEIVNGHTRYLHDGRARDLEEAILWHGGEAQSARDAFVALPAAERRALLAFLGSL